MIEYISKEPIAKGWSGDKKYCAATADGTKYLLRISPIEQYDKKKSEFEMMQSVAALGVPMCQPIEFGTCDEGVYSLQSWIDGQDAEELLPSLSDTEQYELGVKAGQILRQMHTISTSPASNEWESIYNQRLNCYIDNYKKCGMQFIGDSMVLEYIDSARCLLNNRPMCFTHGDYHVGNMIISADKSLTVIDFNRYRIAEPYQAFGSICFSARISTLFATGQIDGYFNNSIPQDFWVLLKLYLSAVVVNGLPWSIPFGDKEITFAYKQIEDIMSWYDNMKNFVPTWYKPNKNNVAYCGLACCVCSENNKCIGCQNGGCGITDGNAIHGWCKNYNCCREKGLNGCWECDDFPCSGGMLDKPRIRAFARFAKEYGTDELAKCLLRNKEKGIVYHYNGQLVGDYDKCETEEEIIKMIKTGKKP